MTPCRKTPGVACARQEGHMGACTAAPAAHTLDFDEHYRRKWDSLTILADLDWPAPVWADLLD